MFVVLFCLSIAVSVYLALTLWCMRSDRDYFKNRVCELVHKMADRERLEANASKEQTAHDERIAKILRGKNEALAEALQASCHNYNEGQAAQLELDNLRDRLRKSQAVLFAEPDVVRIGTTPPPKGWDVLKVGS